MAYQSKRGIPLASMEKIMKDAGAERVSDDAKSALKDALEEIALNLSKTAMKFALHAGRKTIKANDIRLAQSAK